MQMMRQEQRQELKQTLRMELTSTNLFSIPFEVLYRRARSNTTCPQCFHKLTVLQVRKGFSNDPFVIFTECPKCSFRFVVNLKILLSDLGKEEFFWLCPRQLAQTIYEELDGRRLSKKELKGRYGLIINIAKNFTSWREFKKYYLSLY